MLWYFLNFTTCQQLCQVLEIMEGICLWSSKTCVIKSMRAKKVWWGGEKNVLKKFKEDNPWSWREQHTLEKEDERDVEFG